MSTDFSLSQSGFDLSRNQKGKILRRKKEGRAEKKEQIGVHSYNYSSPSPEVKERNL
jgi:hypothetical protein